MPARLTVLAILNGFGQPPCRQPDSLKTDRGGGRVVPRAAIGLDSMAERIDAGGGSQARRQRQCQLRVTDHQISNHVQIHRNHLRTVKTAHHTGAPDLGPGAGGCRNGDLRRHLANRRRTASLDVIVCQSAAMTCQQRHRLGKVDW